jgi:hypothetical protein
MCSGENSLVGVPTTLAEPLRINQKSASGLFTENVHKSLSLMFINSLGFIFVVHQRHKDNDFFYFFEKKIHKLFFFLYLCGVK